MVSKRYKRIQARPHQQKVNPAFSGITLLADLPQPRSMPKNYKSYAREGYGGNDTLFKVVNYGTTNGGAIPPVLFTDRTMKNGRIDNHPLLDKLNMPNPEMSGVFYRKAVLGYFLIAGNSYQYAIRDAKSGPPDELWPLQPDKVRPIADAIRGVSGYEYDDFPPEKNPIAAALIGHMRTWNPEDPIFGMSTVQLAAIMIDAQTASRKWNLSLLQNFLKPPGAWTTTVLMSANERAKVEERVNEKMAGYQNAGKAPVLDGALKWESSAVAPSEMDWLESQKYNSGSIANLFNMAPQLIGDTSASTYDNMEQAEAASYTEYIFPMLDELYDLWNMWLVPMYPDLCDNQGKPKAYLYYDKETVEVVQAAIQARLTAASTRGNTAYMQGVAMLDEARAMQGLPPLPKGAGQVFRLGAVLVPAEKLGDYADQSLTTPAAPPMPQPEPIQLPPPTDPLQGGEGDGKKPANDENKTPDDENNPQDDEKTPPSKQRSIRQTKALDLSTTEEKRAFANSIETTRKRLETTYEQKLASYFEQERKAVTKSLTSSSASSVSVLAGRAEGAINDQQVDLKNLLLDLYHTTCVEVGGQVSSALSGKKGVIADFLNMFGESQLKYLLLLAGIKIKQISTVTLAKVRLELTDGVAQGESIPELAKRVDSLYLDQIIPNRSTTIARTEVVASSNYASVQSAQSSGLTLHKVWLATEDARTRPDHSDADGQEVAMDDQFDVGGEKLDYPGDSSGSPENVINCRCTVYYKRVASDDDTDEEDDDDDTVDEKRRKRLEYRRFMEATLA